MGSHHNHSVKKYNKAFAVGIILNIAYVIVEFAYGLLFDSMVSLGNAVG